jgi:predicted TIM-barrel fold metal-dependent hydrolase
LRLFDCDIAYGRGALGLPREIESVDDVLAEMDHSGIDEALVWCRDAFERDFASGNRRAAELKARPRLHPVWTFVPTCCDEMPGADQFIAQMRVAGVRAVRAFPTRNCFHMDPVSCGDLFEAFIAHAIPVFVPLTELPDRWRGVYELLRNFPELTLVLTQTGCWGEDRYFRPLMRRYRRFFITTDRLETAGQLKSMVDTVGPHHLLFGSGLPRNYPGAYILSLVRAPIGDAAREPIAHGNIERLLGEVSW